MGSINYQDVDNIPEVGSLPTNARVLLVSPTGLARATRETLIGATMQSKIVAWDAQASYASVGVEPIPYTRLHEIDPVPTNVSIPTVDDATNTVTKAAKNSNGKDAAYWSLRGAVPATGSHWAAFNADVSGASTVHRIYIGQQVVHDLVGAVPEDCVGHIEITPTQIKAVRYSDQTEDSVNLSVATQKVLLQISPTGIEVFATAGFSFDFGARPAGDLRIGGAILSSDNVAQTLVINASDVNTAPRMPDAGFNPLALVEVALPGGTAIGDVLYPLTGGVLGDQHLIPRTKYQLLQARTVVGLVSLEDAAMLEGYNVFANEIGYNTDYVLATVEDDGNDPFVYIGPRTGGFKQYVDDPTSVENAIVIGECFNAYDGSFNSNLYGIGHAFNALESGSRLVGIGQVGNQLDSTSFNAVAIGPRALVGVSSLQESVAIGNEAMSGGAFSVQRSVAIGDGAMSNHVPDAVNEQLLGNVVVGYNALSAGAISHHNVAIGLEALATASGTSGNAAANNVAIGSQALHGRTGIQYNNIAIGPLAMNGSTTSQLNVAVGNEAARFLSGTGNVAVGDLALAGATGTITNCTALGKEALRNLSGAFSNATAIGFGATVTGSNQVQLGNSDTTTFAYGAVQNRSDERDKTDVRPTQLGLDFILGLEPVDYRYDYREDYLDVTQCPVAPTPPGPEPKMPPIAKDDPSYDIVLNMFLTSHSQWKAENDRYERDNLRYQRELMEWRQYTSLTGIEKDGSKARTRFHHGFIAQKVKELADAMEIDFGGYQDHLIKGGRDVKSLGYEEFIAPLVRAVQELNTKITSQEYVQEMTNRVLDTIVADPNNRLIDLIANRMLEQLAAARNR